jgi:hypothetical protein
VTVSKATRKGLSDGGKVEFLKTNYLPLLIFHQNHFIPGFFRFHLILGIAKPNH